MFYLRCYSTIWFPIFPIQNQWKTDILKTAFYFREMTILKMANMIFSKIIGTAQYNIWNSRFGLFVFLAEASQLFMDSEIVDWKYRKTCLSQFLLDYWKTFFYSIDCHKPFLFQNSSPGTFKKIFFVTTFVFLLVIDPPVTCKIGTEQTSKIIDI